MNRILSLLALLQITAPVSDLVAQTAPPPPPPVEEIVELSPFTVNAAADKGYRAENTLAGSRLNTSLRDTPASVTAASISSNRARCG